MKKKVKLVEITWEDHWGSSSDWTLEEILAKENRFYFTSVGYVKAETKDRIWISTQLQTHGDNHHRAVHCIIKSCIRKTNFIGWRNL